MSDFLNAVSEGALGNNKGLHNSFSRFNSYLNGTQKGVYYAVAGQSGTGKTAITDANFILEPYFKFIDDGVPLADIPMRAHYYSFEISKNAKIAKWIAYRIYQKYGKLTDANEILSRGNSQITPEIHKLVHQVYPEIIDLFKIIRFYDEPLNPFQIYKQIFDHAEATGTLHTKTLIGDDGRPYKLKTGYTPNKDRTNMIIVDHVGLTKRPKGYTKKDTIDKLSEFMVIFRNLLNYTPVIISQFNRGLTSIDRQKFKASDLCPGMEDFKDSGNVPEDANICIGIMDANKLNIKNYLGYDITQLKQNFRAINLMKNRDGKADVNIGVQFVGQNGMIKELPLPFQFDTGIEDYKNYIV